MASSRTRPAIEPSIAWTSAKASGPLATAASQYTSTRLPAASTTPVNRWEMDSNAGSGRR